MKTKPKDEQRVYWVYFDPNYEGSPCKSSQLRVMSDDWGEITGGYKFNLFATKKQAIQAKKKIIKILAS